MDTIQGEFPVVCFGKLPAYGDFVRYNAAGREIQSLDQWFQEGMHSAEVMMHSDWEIAFLESLPYYFLFSPNFGERSLLGIFFPSYDKVGRKYPFIIALAVDRKQIPQESISYIPILFKPFIDKACEVGKDIVKAQMAPDIPQIMNQLGDSVNLEFISMMKLYDDYKNNTTIDQYLSRVWDRFNKDRKYNIIENLTRILQSLQSGKITRLSYGLRIPVGIDSDFNIYDTTFCLELILKLLSHNPLLPYQFFVNSDSQNSSNLFLFFSTPSPKNFVGLIHLDQELDTIYNLETPVVSTIAEPESQINPELNYLLEAGDRNLNELLQQI